MPIDSQHYQTIRELESAVKAIRSPALTDDIYLAIRKTLEWYIRRNLPNRFKGRRYNPDYPRLNIEYIRRKFATFGALPILVRTGLMKKMVLNSAKVSGNKRTMTISCKGPYYSKFLKRRGFHFLPPKLPRERRMMRQRFYKELSKIRKKRKQIS